MSSGTWKPDSNMRSLPPVRVYREHLEHISALAAADGRVELRCEGFLYDSFEALAAHRRVRFLRSLVIQPVDGAGAAAVAITPTRVEIFTLSESTRGADQITELLRRLSCGLPLWWRVAFDAFAWLVAILLGVLFWRMSGLPELASALVGGFVAVFVASILASVRRALGESVVYLGNRGGPALGPLVFVAAVSGLIGIVIGVLVS